MAAQAIGCGYYGVFVMLMVGFAILVGCRNAGTLWSDRRFWLAVASGALVAVALVAPSFVPYRRFQRRRVPADARRRGAIFRELERLPRQRARTRTRGCSLICRAWTEVDFPGFVAIVFGAGRSDCSARAAEREILLVYGGLALLAFWASFGPSAGLVLGALHARAAVRWMRAPARFGLIVGFALSVLAGSRCRGARAAAARRPLRRRGACWRSPRPN